MSQETIVNMTETESLEVVKNYLKQINTNDNESECESENNKIINVIESFVSNETQTECAEKNESDEEIKNLQDKIQLQKILDIKLNNSIEKEKELLRITQEKLVCEVKLLDTIKQRLLDEEKLNKILNEPKEQNVSSATNLTDNKYIDSEMSTTKVIKSNPVLLRMYKR